MKVKDHIMSRTRRAVQNDYSSESAARMIIDIDKAIQVSMIIL